MRTETRLRHRAALTPDARTHGSVRTRVLPAVVTRVLRQVLIEMNLLQGLRWLGPAGAARRWPHSRLDAFPRRPFPLRRLECRSVPLTRRLVPTLVGFAGAACKATDPRVAQWAVTDVVTWLRSTIPPSPFPLSPFPLSPFPLRPYHLGRPVWAAADVVTWLRSAIPPLLLRELVAHPAFFGACVRARARVRPSVLVRASACVGVFACSTGAW
jgi:hypothetical protein